MSPHIQPNIGIRLIRVQGQVLHSGIHGGVIFNPGSNGHGLYIQISKAAKGHADLVAFQNIIFNKGCVGTVGKEIHGIFTGMFIWQRHKKREKYVIDIEQIENLDVKVNPGTAGHDRPN